jgi:hypothetical protein
MRFIDWGKISMLQDSFLFLHRNHGEGFAEGAVEHLHSFTVDW